MIYQQIAKTLFVKFDVVFGNFTKNFQDNSIVCRENVSPLPPYLDFLLLMCYNKSVKLPFILRKKGEL